MVNAKEIRYLRYQPKASSFNGIGTNHATMEFRTNS